VLEPEIARAKAGESVLLFMDGVHFVQLAFLACLWRFTRIFVRSPSGRKRWYVLGAFNAISGQFTMVANDGYNTATTVCELLHKLAAQYAGKPIVIVLDNARYQHCNTTAQCHVHLHCFIYRKSMFLWAIRFRFVLQCDILAKALRS
jgi:hypothetical protein